MNRKNEFYQDKDEKEKFNDICVQCPYNCKQSFRAKIIDCKFLREKHKRK